MTAALDRDRLVAFIWFDTAHPSAPAEAAQASETPR
jgi:hypothetical protein